MREIKFRAWDRINGMFRKQQMIKEPSLSRSDISKGCRINDVFNDKEFIFMQYTGLKDSKYNKICDGDIVLRKGKMYRIIFEIGSFMLSPIDDIDMDEEFINCWNDHVYPLSQLYFENGDLEDILSDLTIIGNIHENKELLEW